jgi:hypothetical protein
MIPGMIMERSLSEDLMGFGSKISCSFNHRIVEVFKSGHNRYGNVRDTESNVCHEDRKKAKRTPTATKKISIETPIKMSGIIRGVYTRMPR